MLQSAWNHQNPIMSNVDWKGELQPNHGIEYAHLASSSIDPTSGK